MKAKWLVVGAGLTGAVFAERIATQLGDDVVIIDHRDHIAGNTYDCVDEDGVLIHRYGPHIFHTNDQRVSEYLSQFTEWRPYEHRVLAQVQGNLIPVPFNFTSLEMLFPANQASMLKSRLIECFGADKNVPILQMITHPDPQIKELSQFIFTNVFENYTLKQWGLRPEVLGPSVTGRVPVRTSYDDRYFQDRFQQMPLHGYTRMVERMLDQPNIHIELNMPFEAAKETFEFERVLYTGPVDEYFGYAHGPLPYRSLRFDLEHVSEDSYQAVGTVNFPNDHAYTRITEFKHLTGQVAQGSSIMREFPCNYVPGANDPLYPIPLEANAGIYALYEAEAKKLDGQVLFAGRLGDYKYYNMDQAVARALVLYRKVAGVY